MSATYEDFVLPPNYGTSVSRMALGKSIIDHGSGLPEFASFDTPLPRYMITLKYIGIKERSGSWDATPYGTGLSDFDYLWGFYERNVAAGLKIFKVTGIVKGDADAVVRLFYFSDNDLSMDKFTFQLWSGSIKMLQFGVGDYGVQNLPSDPMF